MSSSSSSSSSSIGTAFTTQTPLVEWGDADYLIETTQTALIAGAYRSFSQYTTQTALIAGTYTAFVIQTTQVPLIAWVIRCDSPSYVPPPPTGEITLTLSLPDPYGTTIDLSWTSLLAGLTYDVYRGTAVGQEVLIASDLSGTTYQDSDLTHGVVYYYKIVGTNVCGSETTSNEASLSTGPALPVVQIMPNNCPNGTGWDVAYEAMLRLGEDRSTLASQQQQLYTRHVRREMSDVAKTTFSLYRNAVTDLIAGQQEYCPPSRPFSRQTINILDGQGNVWPLNPITAAQADNKPWYHNWRSPQFQVQGIPSTYIEEGISNYVLYPVPNYSMENGVIISGYWAVGEWFNMADCLPREWDCDANFFEVLVLGVCIKRCMEMMSRDPATYGPLLQMYEPRYKDMLDTLRMESMRRSAGRRSGVVPDNPKVTSAWSTSWGWGPF